MGGRGCGVRRRAVAHCLSAATMQPEDVTIWLALADDSLDTVQRYSGPHAFIAAVAAGEPGAVAFAEQIDARAAGLGAFVADAMDAVRAVGIRRGIPGVTRVH